jgi:quercetin dioxygenase-like cupin family protein
MSRRDRASRTMTNMTSRQSPSSAVLLRIADMKAYRRADGVLTTPLVSSSNGARNFITGITELAPGAEVPFHHHDCEESVMLLEGEAAIDVEGREHRLRPLDSTLVPPHVPHRFRNLSTTRRMRILWIYGSRAATRTLEATGETHPVSAEHVAAR